MRSGPSLSAKLSPPADPLRMEIPALTMQDAAARRRSARRGWSVVAGSFGVMFAGFGCTYCFSAFFTPLQEAFAASRAALSWAFSIAVFLYFMLGAASGPLADRFGPRGMTLAGLAVVAVG